MAGVKADVQTYKNYVNGQWVAAASGETFPVYDPSTEEVIAQVAAAGAADVDAAVKAARELCNFLGVGCGLCWLFGFARGFVGGVVLRCCCALGRFFFGGCFVVCFFSLVVLGFCCSCFCFLLVCFPFVCFFFFFVFCFCFCCLLFFFFFLSLLLLFLFFFVSLLCFFVFLRLFFVLFSCFSLLRFFLASFLCLFLLFSLLPRGALFVFLQGVGALAPT